MKTFRHSLQRFPAVTAFVTTLAALLVCLCWGLDDRLTERQIFVSTYYLSVGSVLTLTLRLWGEEVKSRRRRLIVNALCHVALLADATTPSRGTSRCSRSAISSSAARWAVSCAVGFAC